MGRATITTELGEGEYTIEYDRGDSAIQNRIAELQAGIARWTTAKAASDASLAVAEAAATSAVTAISITIVLYRAALEVGDDGTAEKDAMIAAVSDNQARISNVKSARIKSHTYTAKIAAANKKISYLGTFDLVSEEDVFCVDHTLEATGEVGTIEIPGEPAQTLIVPGAATPLNADGFVRARAAQDSAQLFSNLALLPGWQKFSPTYRLGLISNIDSDFDTADVFLDGANSSAQGLDINQTSALYDVPVEYMTCHARAFQAGDSVAVKFDGQDWEQPKIIGFESFPRICPVGRARFIKGGPLGHYNILLKHEDSGGFGNELMTLLRADGAEIGGIDDRIAVEFRMEGEVEFTRMLQDGYHAPAPWPTGPLGVGFGAGYDPATLNQVGRVWFDDLYRFDDLGITDGYEFELAYEWDKEWKVDLYLEMQNFPGYWEGQSSQPYVEIRVWKYLVGDPFPLKKLIHFIIAPGEIPAGVWFVEDVDLPDPNVLPFPSGWDGEDWELLPDNWEGFNPYQPVPDYW